MPTNDFIGFASNGSANILSQADFAAAAEQGTGVQPGPASSKLANKVWRQGANMASALGGLMVDMGQDALDDGDIATLKTNLKAAVMPASSSGKIKLPDGTLIMWGKKASSNTQVQSITFPEAFVDNNNFEISAQFLSGTLSSVNQDARSVLTGSVTKTGFAFVALGITGNAVTPVVGNVSWIAIGRWKV